MQRSSDLTIAMMRKEDIEQIVRIEKLSFSDPWTKRMFYDELANDKARYFVAHKNGCVVGYGGMWMILDEAHITNIAVHPDFRGQGIGEEILKRMILYSASANVVLMTLEVRESNVAAQSLYSKFGFTVCGKRKGYYKDNREDALIMSKIF